MPKRATTPKDIDSYIAGFPKDVQHVSVYPAPVGDPAFKGKLSAYASGRGTAKFPLGKPIPMGLIRDIVKYRAKKIK